MKKLSTLLLIFALSISLFSGCAKDYYTSYQNSKPVESTGTLILNFSSPMQNVNVSMNNQVLAKRKHTEKITINNIPSGKHEVKVVAEDNKRHDLKKTISADIKAGQQNEQLIKSPSIKSSYYIYTGLTTIGLFALSLLFSPGY